MQSYSDRMAISGLLLFALLSLLSTPFCSAISPISLSSLNWTLHNSNGSISIPAAVPGYALDALHTSGAVGDPLYRYCALPCRLLPLFIVTSVSAPMRVMHAHACHIWRVTISHTRCAHSPANPILARGRFLQDERARSALGDV